MSVQSKACTKCGVYRPLSMFSVTEKKTQRLDSRCKICKSTEQRDRERARKNNDGDGRAAKHNGARAALNFNQRFPSWMFTAFMKPKVKGEMV